ncbi:hypothetical protein D3C78_1774540 [compost metagenome]
MQDEFKPVPMRAQPAFLRLVAGDFHRQGFGLLGGGGVAEQAGGGKTVDGGGLGVGEDGAVE